jgi:hypothetical protein
MRGGSRERKSWIPKRGKDHKPQRYGRTQRGGIIHKGIHVFSLLKKTSAVSAFSAVDIFFLYLREGQRIF